ncbi:MAG: ssDNA-binding protein, partial [Bacteroidia bacterium]
MLKGAVKMSKVITGKGRFSYLNWASPKLNEMNGKNEYSTEFLIEKTDATTIAALKAAMKSALDKKWNGKYPSNLRNPLRDGDTETKQD